MLVEMALYSGLAPAAVAAALVWLVLRLARPDDARAGRCGAVLALTGGLLTGCHLQDVTPWKPDASWKWLPYVAIMAAIAELLVTLMPLPALVRWTVRLGLVSLAAWLLVPTLQETAPHLWFWRTVVGGAMVITWCSLAVSAPRLQGAFLLVLLTVIVLAAAGVLEFAGFLRLVLVAGSLAAALIGIGFAGWWRSASGVGSGVAPGIALLLPGLMCNGYFHRGYPDFPMASVVLVTLAPIVLALTGLAVHWLPSRIGRTVLLLAATLAPTGIALFLAAQAGGNE
jgi:hypothetical protein